MSADMETKLLEGLVIEEANFIIGLEAKSYQDVIQNLGKHLFANGYVKGSFVQAVLDREEEYPTGLQAPGGGVAVPHTDAYHVITSTLGIAILSEPVDFRAMAEPEKIISVSLVMMLAVAETKKVVPVLSKVISIIQVASAIESLINATSQQEAKQIFVEHIMSQNRST
jgi:galactitol PTS system EIIA component